MDDPAKTFKPQSEEEHAFYNQVVNRECARFGEHPTNIQDFLLNVAIWSQFTSDCLWDSSWLTKDHEHFKRNGDEQEFPKNTRFDTVCASTGKNIQRSQRRIHHANIAGSGTHFDGQELRCWKIQQQKNVQDEKFTCSWISHCVLESQIQIHLTVGQQNWMMYGTNMDLSKNWILQPEKCDSFSTYCQVLLPFKWNSILGNTWTGKSPESFDERIIFMSMFNDTCQRSGNICDPIQARTLVLLGARVRKIVVERKMRHCRIADGRHIEVSYFPPDIPGQTHSQSSRMQTVLIDYVKIGPVIGLEVFKSAGALVIEVQVPSHQPGNSKSWVGTSRGNEQYSRHFHSCRDWPLKSWSRVITAVNELRATASTGNRWTFGSRIYSCAKAKDFFNLLQLASLEIYPSKKHDQKGLWIGRHLQALHEDPKSYR